MNKKRKYIKNFATFFLAFYSLFIFYAALHTHGIHTHSNYFNYEESHEGKVNHPFLDSENNCRLVTFSNSLYICNLQNADITITNFSSTEIQLYSQVKPLLAFKESLQLRAPPLAS